MSWNYYVFFVIVLLMNPDRQEAVKHSILKYLKCYSTLHILYI